MHRRQVACTVACLILVSGAGPTLLAQGSVRVWADRARFEIPVGRNVQDSWRWNDLATLDGRAEYMWSAQLDGDSSHVVGFMLFKQPGATPQHGAFADLLRAGQLSVASVVRHRAQVLRSVRPSASGADSTLVLEIRDRALIATMFARRPHGATLSVLSPYAEVRTHKVLVSYEVP